MDSIITIRDLSKMFKIPHVRNYNLKTYIVNFRKMRQYEKFYALERIDLDIEGGEFVGIIGRNGSGKSTLLKLIAGILIPTSGEVVVEGDISPFLELGVGFNPELTARENIFLYSAILGLSRNETEGRFADIVAFSELEKFIDSPLKNFSSGMQVRLAFSVAIQSNAPILLVDEVLAVGDAPFQKKCFSVFDRFKREGRTIVYVSHDLTSIQKFCDRVVYLRRGSERRYGKPADMIKLYESDTKV
ncbi:MAG: ABC transporter ATP-binding protein [Spirochaetes bacterium]|nr:ABC transporter ATP-binding protein [Spirochaetota bacterium]